MKKFLITILIATSLSQQSMAHPVHVSVTNLTLEGLVLSITLNTFVDDWETAYFHYFGDTIDLKSDSNLDNEWFNSYLAASLVITENNTHSEMVFTRDTIYFNDLSMTIEMHALLKEQPKSLYIYNAILTDIFADQTNLLIYSFGNTQKGIKFDYKNKQEELKLR